MITVCPKCALTLSVTAGDLRVGQGQVRCGRCAAVFNALAALQDDLSETIEQQRPPDLPGEAVVESVTAPAPDPDPDPESTAAGADLAATTALAAAAGNIGEEHGVLPPAANDPDAAVPPSANDDAIEPAPDRTPDDAQVLQVEVESIVVQPTAEEPAARTFEAPAHFELPDANGGAALDLDLTPAEPLIEAPPAEPRRSGRSWIAASAGLVLLLGLQAVHANRNTLAFDDRWRAPLTAVYQAIDLPLQPHWDPRALEVRRNGEMLADADGGMTLRATVHNRAANSQPLPLLRVVLLDRFGKRVAARDLRPAEYLPKPVAGKLQMLGAGQRVDAEVRLADPGPAASGFELDACLAVATDRLRCASQIAAR